MTKRGTQIRCRPRSPPERARPERLGDATEAEREERLTAQVEVVCERTAAGDIEAGAKAGLEQGEPGNEARRPCGQEHEQRQRSEEAQVGFAAATRTHPARDRRPQLPRAAIEHPRRP